MTGLMQDRQQEHGWEHTMGHGEPCADDSEGHDGQSAIDLSDQRSAPRFTLLIRAAKLTSSDAEFLCVVRDASESGISVRLFHPLPAGLEFTLELPNGDRHPLERVWEREGKAGFRFPRPVALERIVEARGGYAKRPVRLRLEVPCRLVASLRRVQATIANLSQQGAQITTQEHLSLAQRIKLEIDGVPPIAARVRWRREDRYGLSFEDTFQFAELAALAFDLQREAAQLAC
jgi:hypothetical protein